MSKAKYIELNEKIERVSKILEFLLIKLTTAGAVLPSVIITIVDYFILDLGDESFFLPYPIMYVENIYVSFFFA